MKFSDLIKPISKKSPGNTLSQISKPSSAILYAYDNILLKTYIEIATSGDVSLLIISGKPSKDELIDRWEKIVQDNGQRNGDNRYDAYFSLLKARAELIAQHTTVSCHLLLMTYEINWESIDAVRAMGYTIETMTSAAYAKSLEAAKRKSSNLITKSEMKRKEIERAFGGKKTESVSHSYEEIIGLLELALDRTIMDAENLTLAKYNVLKKGVEKKQKIKESEQRANNRR